MCVCGPRAGAAPATQVFPPRPGRTLREPPGGASFHPRGRRWPRGSGRLGRKRDKSGPLLAVAVTPTDDADISWIMALEGGPEVVGGVPFGIPSTNLARLMTVPKGSSLSPGVSHDRHHPAKTPKVNMSRQKVVEFLIRYRADPTRLLSILSMVKPFRDWRS
jgi:hypothetical protein